MQSYKYSDAQLGFQPKSGTKMAIKRNIGNGKSLQSSAVLDLKTGLQHGTMKYTHGRGETESPPNITKMIALKLMPMKPKTRGNETQTISECSKGVNHGGPLSLPLYIVYMDTCVGEMREVQEEKHQE